MRTLLLAFLLTACGGPETGEPAPELCVTRQDVGSGVLLDGWRSPTGTLFAVGRSPSSRVRSADGTWTLDPWQDPALGLEVVHGSSDDDVWALGDTDVYRREPDGTWTPTGAPTEPNELVGLHVFGPDDVIAVRAERADCEFGCDIIDTPVVLHWDGTGWTEERHPGHEEYIHRAAVLPDRTVVITSIAGVTWLGPAVETLYSEWGFSPSAVSVGADGTIAAIDSCVVVMGDPSALVRHDPELDIISCTDVWVGAADDVWISGAHQIDGNNYGAIAHWDGATWSTILSDHPERSFALTGGDGEIFAVGGYHQEVALVGDTSGFTADREVWGLGGIDALATDDVTGKVWSVGKTPVLGTWEEGWQPIPLPELRLSPYDIAASGGRVALTRDRNALHVLDNGVLITTPTEVDFLRVAGADGVLFASGMEADGSLVVWRETGAGWETIDTAALPAGYAIAVWADGADDLWLSLSLDEGGGAIAHWDGAAWELPITGLVDESNWLARLSDGQLYFTQNENDLTVDDPLWVYDGVTAAPVPGTPMDVRAAWRRPDGTWLVTGLVADDDVPYVALQEGRPGGSWTTLLQRNAYELVGSGYKAWTSVGDLSWTSAPCAR